MGSSLAENGQHEHAVIIRDVSHFYGPTQVLDRVNLLVRTGEFFGILGASGSGKTTILRALGGFVFPTYGEIFIGGEPMTRKPAFRRSTTMVFQHLALFPHLSVSENLAYGLKLRHRPKPEIEERVTSALAMVRLTGLGHRRPNQLSGGQQQRVALARALILKPNVVLFDEPLGSLDLKLRLEMQIELKNIHRETGMTFIYVTHDQQEALSLCDRIAIIDQGRIVQVGTTEDVYDRPATRFAASFIGDINFLPGTVVGADERTVTVRCEDFTATVESSVQCHAGDSVVICVRPERIILGPASEVCDVQLSAHTTDVVYSGATRRCVLQLGSGVHLNVVVDARQGSALAIGQQVNVGWNCRDTFAVAD
jgi:ABC-type Fe3+/spermidine/putrescine transport system ATPase subunit